MATAYVGLGSNIRPREHLPAALGRLARVARVEAVSHVYRSAAVGAPGTPDFWNAAARVETALAPDALKRELRAIEAALGRVRGPDENAPRTIDLDVLVYEDVVDPSLPLPDPYVETQPFVAVPLLDVAPELAVPGSGRRLADVVAAMDTSGLRVVAHALGAPRAREASAPTRRVR